MRLPVLLFASCAEVLGRDRLEIALPAGAVVGDLMARLRELPGGDRLPPSLAIAVNRRYAAAGDAIGPGDEVAVIPPVAGG